MDERGWKAASEDVRLAFLASYDLLDTAAESGFDRLVRMARATFDAPIALLSFVDGEREWFKSEIGLGRSTVACGAGFAHLAIADGQPFLVDDASLDPRFAGCALVEGAPHVRACAGAPLIVAPGVCIGTIAVCDTKARTFAAAEMEMLIELAHVAEDELSLRRARREAEQARHQLHAAIEVLPDGFMLFDETDRLVLFNRRMGEMFPPADDVFRLGITYEEMFRKAILLGWFPESMGNEDAFLAAALAYHRNPVGSMEQPIINGGWLRISETKTRTGATVGFRVDITELKRREQELFELATRDALTGVLTRRSILDELEHELARAARYGHACSVLVVDADHFKQVNDKCGHQVGDEVLTSIAARIASTIRESDRVGRLGGEEFIVLLADTDLGGAMRTAERLRLGIETISIPVRAGRVPGAVDAPARVTVSIGVAEFRIGESADDLYARADNCLYQAKAGGRNRVECDCKGDVWGTALGIAG
ncbi:diguanylate cyclase [Breoghania corrubedonensis]|nr:diguanylate cyclase [Breoghania corrubedonensis]